MHHWMHVKLGGFGDGGVQRYRPLFVLPVIDGFDVERVGPSSLDGASGVLGCLDRCQCWMVGKVLQRCFDKRCKSDGTSTTTLLEFTKCGMPSGLTS